MPDAGLPIYTARVLDVVPWSDAGWCIIIIRFPDISAPLVLDDLCLDPTKLYRIGADLDFTLSGIAYDCQPSEERASIEFHWELDLTRHHPEEAPAVPGSSYKLHGVVLDCTPERLRIDCGLVVELTPRVNFQFPPLEPGSRVCVRCSLHITVVEPGNMGWGTTHVLRENW